ncbi:hypothetical protein IB276_11880 [Ensifer sp. ENS04]|uniref:hypothetical protein n=1 Tax=Ensifer sp. ENS04 TaxID=2769281 RepID=UPI00178369EC|nr:hypothetical protein [Ensifer sp. ENS04]MBD9540153.1 hypothetical protein [Ensifer sp. ENS04]
MSATENTRIYLANQLDEIQVSMASRGQLDEFLEPRLWEELRVRLQELYRKATGEPMAVLAVEDAPRQAEGGEE